VAHIIRARDSADGPRTLDVVSALSEEQSVTELAERFDTSRRQIYRTLDPLADAGLLVRDDGFESTAAASRVLDAYELATAHTDADGLAYLAGSEHRPAMLRALDTESMTKRDLMESETLPSRTTVHRSVDRFETEGWVTTAGGVELTPAGRTTLSAFDEFVVSVEQVVEKAPLLRQLDSEIDLPLPALTETELITERGDDPFALLEASIEAADIRGSGVGHVRTVVPFFSPVMFSEFESLVDRETTFEVIYTQTAYQQLTTPRNARYLAGFLFAPYVEIRIYPEPLTWGLGLYDDTVMLAGSTESSEQAAVVGETPAFTTWANETFDGLWARSETPSERLKRWVGALVSPSPAD
jgi:predicted transcriptional regulator